MRQITCINCSQQGHAFKDCLKPVTSHGILAFKRGQTTAELSADDLKFLLIQRKDSIGYIDFIRGKYSVKLSKEIVYKTLVEEMTKNEKQKIITTPFDAIWDQLWVNHRSRAYLNEYEAAKSKFFQIDVYNMITNTESKWDETEFGIPKGRRNNHETYVECAIREFTEETGYKKNEFQIINYNNYLEEVFIGSNGITYRHVYYLAEILTPKIPDLDPTNLNQAGEVKQIKWFSFKECINIFRSYDTTKRSIIYKARKIIQSLYRVEKT